MHCYNYSELFFHDTRVLTENKEYHFPAAGKNSSTSAEQVTITVRLFTTTNLRVDASRRWTCVAQPPSTAAMPETPSCSLSGTQWVAPDLRQAHWDRWPANTPFDKWGCVFLCWQLPTLSSWLKFAILQPIPLGWHCRILFQSSKLKARTCHFTETWQKRRSSFELWAFEKVNPSSIGCIYTLSFLIRHVGSYQTIVSGQEIFTQRSQIDSKFWSVSTGIFSYWVSWFHTEYWISISQDVQIKKSSQKIIPLIHKNHSEAYFMWKGRQCVHTLTPVATCHLQGEWKWCVIALILN